MSERLDNARIGCAVQLKVFGDLHSWLAGMEDDTQLGWFRTPEMAAQAVLARDESLR